MKPYNIVFLTLDDLNYDSLGCFGSPIKDISPNIDSLCNEGTVFRNSHVTVAVCQPSRSVLLTGRYPFKNGARGFEAIDTSCTTLTERLQEAGYLNGIIGKEDHVAPKAKFCWDYYVRTMNDENDYGRNPERYYEHCHTFINQAKQQGKPFFLMANSHDPHRPFANSEDEIKKFGRTIACSWVYDADGIPAKGCLPDLPKIRKELAQYYTSVHRADEMVGRVIDTLKDLGVYDQTLVLFLSDNGMSLPFCKTNCYLNSTKSPYILKLPKDLQAQAVREVQGLVNGIDVTPTFLDLLDLPPIEGLDGMSFVPMLMGKKDNYSDIYTMFFKTSVNPKTKEPGYYPMRAVTSKQYIYIYNGWSNGTLQFRNESMQGLTFDAMENAAQNDKAIKDRVALLQFRVKEEMYDIIQDPECLHNLIEVVPYIHKIKYFQKRMLSYMQKTQDGFLDKYYREIIHKNGV